MDQTAKLIAVVILASFATERVVAATSYTLNAIRVSRRTGGTALRLRRREKRNLLLLGISALIAVVVVERAEIRILTLLGLKAPAALDYVMSCLIVLGGADRLRSLLGTGAAQKSEPPAIRIDVDGNVRELKRVS